MQLRESQKAALSVLTERDRHFAAVWAEPRSGKTAVALGWIEYIRPKVAVVVGPKIAEAVWKTESAKWLKSTYRFFSLTAGNTYPSPGQFKGVTILFVNYDQFGVSPFKRLKPYLASLAKLCSGRGAMLLDESHMIKTPSSVTGRNIRPLAHQWHYRLLMTGTPVTNPNQIDAVYRQWTFLDPDIRNEWPSARSFREHFGEWTTFKGFPELVRPIHQAELNAYIQKNVVTMTGAGDPVPIRRVTYPVPYAVEKLGKDLLKYGVTTVGDHSVAALNPLTRLLRMRTLMAGWLKDDEGNTFTVPEAANARLKALSAVLRKCNGKVIVACTHLHEIGMVRRYLHQLHMSVLVITGATKDKDWTIEQYQRDSDIRVLLVQPRTVAMAVDISVAEDLVWYTSDFNYVTFKQTTDRIKLSPASPRAWVLCGRGSVDEDVWVTLQKDHDHLGKVVKRIGKNIFR